MDWILGQDKALGILRTQLASGRTHHAYVFSGPRGVGKFTTALAFARVLLCHGRPETGGDDLETADAARACGECASCRSLPMLSALSAVSSPVAETSGDAAARPVAEGVDSGPESATGSHSGEAGDGDAASSAAGHPDLHIVTKELAAYSDDAAVRNRKLTQIPVEVLRDHLLEPVQRAAGLGRGKVFIIDEAELLNAAGQNLLLKTLEEPPAGTTIVLVTASEDRLLPTIRSRCHRLAFVPLAEEVVERHVRNGLPRWQARARATVAEAESALQAGNRQTRKRREEQLEAAKQHLSWLEALSQERLLRWLIEFADGSLGRAKLAVDHDLAEWAQTVLGAIDGLAQGRVAGTLGQQIAARIDAFAQRWVERHANASKEAANKLAADLMGSLIAVQARRRLKESAQGGDTADPLAQEAALEPWLRVIDATERMRELLASNVNLSLACDHLSVMLTRDLTAAGGERATVRR